MSQFVIHGLNEAGRKGKSVVTWCNGCAFRFFNEFGQTIKYTSLYSNPTANKEVWGALLYTTQTLLPKKKREALLHKDPTVNTPSSVKKKKL